MGIEQQQGQSAQFVYGVYRGGDGVDYHSLDRGFTAFGHHMRMVVPDAPKLDSVMVNQIDRARNREGGTDVVVLDLGAGVGNFTREFLIDEAVGEKVRRRLAGKAISSKLKFYSVSDASSEQSHLSFTPFPATESGNNENITAHQVEYSITSSQSVKSLLQAAGERSVDIVVASNFMQYLRPKVFENVLQDTVDVLEPGGVFMAFGYAGLAGKFLSADDSNAEVDKPVIFKDPAKQGLPGISSETLRAKGEELLANTETDTEQMMKAIDDILSVMFSGEYWSQPEMGEFRGLVRKGCRVALEKGDTPQGLFAHLLHDILPIAELNEQIQEMKKEKDAIVDALRDHNSGIAVVMRNRIPDAAQGVDAIVIKKRLVGSHAIRAAKRTHPN